MAPKFDIIFALCLTLLGSALSVDMDEMEYGIESQFVHVVEFTDAVEFADEIQAGVHFVLYYSLRSELIEETLAMFDALAYTFNKEEMRNRLTCVAVNCDGILESICQEQHIRHFPTLMLYDQVKRSVDRYEGQKMYDDVEKFIDEKIPPPVESQLLIPKHVRELTDDTFEREVSVGKQWIMFYSPTCPHCHQLEPIWLELAEKLYMENVDIRLARMDCMEHMTVCMMNSIAGYPTLLFFSNGKPIQKYKGVRTLDMLIGYAKGMNDFMKTRADSESDSSNFLPIAEGMDAIIGLPRLTAATYHELMEVGYALVMFYQPACDHCKDLMSIWASVYEHFRNTKRDVQMLHIDCTEELDACTGLDIFSYPTLVFYTYGQKLEIYDGARDINSIVEFVIALMSHSGTNEQISTIDYVSYPGPVEFEEILKNSTYVFVNFFKLWCVHSRNLESVWRELSVAMSEFRNVTIVGINCSMYESVCTRNEVGGYPSMYLYIRGKRQDLYTGPHDLKSIQTYLSSYVSMPQQPPIHSHAHYDL